MIPLTGQENRRAAEGACFSSATCNIGRLQRQCFSARHLNVVDCVFRVAAGRLRKQSAPTSCQTTPSHTIPKLDCPEAQKSDRQKR
jgi:hypothetical protein